MKNILKIAAILTVASVSIMVSSSGEDTTTWKLPPETARLKPAPGVELVTGNCLVCHSADYISTQPPMNRKKWEATVLKMKAKYGAPLMTNNIDPIVTYLVTEYGKE
jgi:hypothetical protein